MTVSRKKIETVWIKDGIVVPIDKHLHCKCGRGGGTNKWLANQILRDTLIKPKLSHFIGLPKHGGHRGALASKVLRQMGNMNMLFVDKREGKHPHVWVGMSKKKALEKIMQAFRTMKKTTLPKKTKKKTKQVARKKIIKKAALRAPKPSPVSYTVIPPSPEYKKNSFHIKKCPPTPNFKDHKSNSFLISPCPRPPSPEEQNDSISPSLFCSHQPTKWKLPPLGEDWNPELLSLPLLGGFTEDDPLPIDDGQSLLPSWKMDDFELTEV